MRYVWLILSMALYIIGTATSFYGFAYYFLVNPKEDWIKIFNEIHPDNLWIMALLILITGVYTAISPVMYVITKYFTKEF